MSGAELDELLKTIRAEAERLEQEEAKRRGRKAAYDFKCMRRDGREYQMKRKAQHRRT